MEAVPRELFVPRANRHLSYEDGPLPIGEGQTISQPSIVATMTDALELRKEDSVLEVGTGSGYQSAVLARLVRQVYTVERLPSLMARARQRLLALGCVNVEVLPAGPVLGCPEKAPFDAILVAAASPGLPQVLLEQLAEGGRMVIPAGSHAEQTLMKVVRRGRTYSVTTLGACRFVPLLGPGAWDGG